MRGYAVLRFLLSSDDDDLMGAANRRESIVGRKPAIRSVDKTKLQQPRKRGVMPTTPASSDDDDDCWHEEPDLDTENIMRELAEKASS